MFKNSVFRVSVDTKQWLAASFRRAIRTAAQTAIASIGASTMFTTVDWKVVGSTVALAAILSLLNSIGGLPEVPAVNADGE